MTSTATKRDEQREALAAAMANPTVRAPFRAWHIDEPAVLVGEGDVAPDPKTGIAQWGPWHTPEQPQLSDIRIAIIGTREEIDLARAWFERCRHEIRPDAKADVLLFPAFPGLEADTGFGCRVSLTTELVEVLTPAEVARITRAADRDAGVEAAAVVLRARMEALADRDIRPSVVVVALSDEIRKAAGGGRRRQRRSRRKPKRPSNQLSLNFLDPKPLEPFRASRTLHRVVKAEGMRVGIPTQLAWPLTFKGGAGVQDDATRAWNLCTALYYKAGGVPWRVKGLDRGTCYVGISFYRPVGAPTHLQTSMAQAFSDRGEGTVLRGAPLEWDPRQGSPVLSRGHAKELLRGVLEQYTKHHRTTPTRVVVYKTSRMQEDEIAGFRDALGSIPYYDFLSIGPSKVRFLRSGAEPPIRGSVVQVEQDRYVVYTRGYVPYLGVYPGLRIPQPLDVRHHGTHPVTDIVREMLALTRMNWNSADFAAAEPITLGFARTVGLVLSELPDDIEPATAFRFYM